MSIQDKLLKAAAGDAPGGITPSEHFGVVLYEGDGSSSHSINGGKFGAAGFFENAGVIQIPDNITNTNEHSFSVWFNVNDASGNQTLLEIDTGNRIIFRIASTDANKANFGNGGWFNHGLSFSANQWYHLAITFKSGSPAKIYVDGSLQYTTGNISKASYGSNNYLGAANGSGSGSVQGKIDQFRVFQKELSSSEVSTLYAETASTVESLDPLSEDTTDTLQVLGDSSCVATYRFENNEDDESGNYDGTGTEIQYAAGRYGQAASFNGSSSYVSLSNASTILGTPSGQTISCWAKFNSVSSSGYNNTTLLSANDGSNPHWQITLYDGKIYGDYFQTSTIYRQRNGSTSISANTWYHFVITFDSTDSDVVQFYVNGQAETGTNLTSGGTFTGNIQNPSLPIRIGRRDLSSGSWYMDGEIDQVRIFNKALSASEVTTLYQENSLVASYRFEGNANDDTRNNDGTASNVSYEYGLGFTPDFVWLKQRGNNTRHRLVDSTRGATNYLVTDGDDAEFNSSTNILSFDTGGFSVGTATAANADGGDYVAWCLKANGGTTSSNTDGSITSTVQVNTDSGFSIVKHTNSGSTSSTVGHGLGVAPKLYITKKYTTTTSWWVYTTVIDGSMDQIKLNSTDAKLNSSINAPTSTVFYNQSGTNDSAEYITYAFAEVDGFSKFGTYTGLSTSGKPLVETGFEPAFVMGKYSSGTGDWWIVDNKRNLTNPRNSILRPNLRDAEYQGSSDFLTFLSNGFEINNTSNTRFNANGGTYIYMAFAADPDTEAPTVAKSFSTVTYTGNGGTNEIEGLGFSPSFVWLKGRSGTYNHWFYDTVRGANNGLNSNSSAATNTTTGLLSSFDTDGFTLGSNGEVNQSSTNYVAWAWKADDNEPTLFGGPAKAVYKFEDNANDVTGSFNGTASNVSYVTGNFNKAADFNGLQNSSASYVEISSDTTSPVSSISLWIKTSTKDSNEGNILEAGGGSSANTGFAITRAPSTGYLRVRFANGSVGNIQTFVGTTDITDDNWHHIVLSMANNNTFVLYLDGESHITGTRTRFTTSDSHNLSISRFGTSAASVGASSYDGLIDQVRIYNGAVSDIGVAALYAETTSDNDDLTLGAPKETIISANANAGFSIVKYEGDGNVNKQISHGLSAAPDMVIVKELTDAGHNWRVNHKDLTSGYNVMLNLTSGEVDGATNGFLSGGYIGAMSSTTFEVKSGSTGVEAINQTGDSYIAYCFHSVSGYSKFGSYSGNNTGQTITTGFQPDFLMLKKTNVTSEWWIMDSVRGTTNNLEANTSDAENTGISGAPTFVSTGFNFSGSTFNETGTDWIYVAFKIN